MKDDLEIVIPTYRRTERQATLRNLPPEWQRRTTLVVDRKDFRILKRLKVRTETGCKIVIAPSKTIAQKRKWIIEHWGPGKKILMLDDDLRFCRRDYTKTPTFIAGCTHKDIDFMMRLIQKKLETFAHVGVCTRQGNNNLEAQQRKSHGFTTPKELRWWPNYRMIYALGYNTSVLLDRCKLGRIEHREDMDYCMQLLRQGYENRVLAEFTVDQLYNSKGGASVDRKVEESNDDADKLAKLHPDLVKVVDKQYKISMPRKEVVCYWKKAYAQSQGAKPAVPRKKKAVAVPVKTVKKGFTFFMVNRILTIKEAA